MTNTDLGVTPPHKHRHFVSAYRKVEPSFSPLPKNILFPQEELRAGVSNPQEGGAVDSVRLLQLNTVRLALIPD